MTVADYTTVAAGWLGFAATHWHLIVDLWWTDPGRQLLHQYCRSTDSSTRILYGYIIRPHRTHRLDGDGELTARRGPRTVENAPASPNTPAR